jgi:hypothetical protein
MDMDNQQVGQRCWNTCGAVGQSDTLASSLWNEHMSFSTAQLDKDAILETIYSLHPECTNAEAGIYRLQDGDAPATQHQSGGLMLGWWQMSVRPDPMRSWKIRLC